MHWKSQSSADGTVVLSGALDEHAEPAFFDMEQALPAGKALVLDLARISQVNASGHAIWVKAFQRLAGKREVELHRCSTAFIRFANLLGASNGYLDVITSLSVAFECKDCHHEFEQTERRMHLVQTTKAVDASCPQCGADATAGDAMQDVLTFCETIRKQGARRGA